LLRAAVSLLGEAAEVGIFSREPQGETVLRLFSGPGATNPAVSAWLGILGQASTVGKLVSQRVGGRDCGALMLQLSELAGEQMLLAYTVEHVDGVDRGEEIACLARIYGSQVRLLDYSELDSLTRLLNRKTFDETFDRLLTSSSSDAPDDGLDERRDRLGERTPAWLCVIDIDHFKRVNDSFGHLFGDEVLLRMGELMRKTFRGGDRLFRFGGEEFVVILNAADENLAATSFNRFRLSVENHEFPQVGQVTCSVGFTAVSPADVPTDVLGRADEALYYAKQNGRNRVCCHERLVAAGAIAKPGAKARVAVGFDIDALFAGTARLTASVVAAARRARK
jgi:diguanylate cyclase (GGDEF)-like protein